MLSAQTLEVASTLLRTGCAVTKKISERALRDPPYNAKSDKSFQKRPLESKSEGSAGRRVSQHFGAFPILFLQAFRGSRDQAFCQISEQMCILAGLR